MPSPPTVPLSIAKTMVKSAEIVNVMTVAPSRQVMLKVRFLEAARSAERDLGVNWFGTNRSGTRGFSTGLGQPNIPGANTVTTNTSNVGSGSGSVVTGTASTGGISVIQSSGAIVGNTGVPFATVLANLVSGNTNIDVMITRWKPKGSSGAWRSLTWLRYQVTRRVFLRAANFLYHKLSLRRLAPA